MTRVNNINESSVPADLLLAENTAHQQFLATENHYSMIHTRETAKDADHLQTVVFTYKALALLLN